MTDREKAIVMAYTGIRMLTGDKFQIFHKYVEDIMGKPIMIDDIGWLEYEIKEKSKADFMALCNDESSSEKQTKWIPVSEKLPEFTMDIPIVGKRYTEDVLVYDGADLRVGYFVRNDVLDFSYWVAYGEDDYEPIAWMPIEPYKAERSDKE